MVKNAAPTSNQKCVTTNDAPSICRPNCTGTEQRHRQGDRRMHPKERARFEIAVSPTSTVSDDAKLTNR